MSKQLSPEELTELVEQQGGSLVLFAGQWSWADAEDIVQNAFILLLRENNKHGSPDNPTAWLYRVVRNEAISRWRSEKQRKIRERERVISLPKLAASDELFFDADDLKRSLETLNRDQREIVMMRIFGNLSFDEIVKTVGRSRTTVFRHYREALELIKISLLDQENKRRADHDRS